MKRLEFPHDFIWGVATASYQVEGAVYEGGREQSIWDVFTRKPGAVYGGENGDVACDEYHRYKEDVALMAQLGFKCYRFSLSWVRIIHAATGEVNKAGIEYYRALCNELHKYGMRACATIYHWDLPQYLQDKGGWAARETVEAYVEYAGACFREFGDLIDQWITFNEPYCIAYLGYYTGVHAPGIKDLSQTIRAIHHLNLAHGLAVNAYRKTGLKAPIGITLNLNTPRPATSRKEDIEAASILKAVESEVFVHPLFGKGYPEVCTGRLGFDFPVKAGDFDIMKAPIDFIGMNYYREDPVVYDETAPFLAKLVTSWQDTSDMGWYITPAGLLRQMRWMHEISKGLPLFVTENGYANVDLVSADGQIHDKPRIEYLKKHFEVCAQAIKENINLKGYFVWSFMDNFEWAVGYTKRFGIVYIDYSTQERIPKDSAYFFRDTIAGYCEW
jgi:beta-glucosidase